MTCFETVFLLWISVCCVYTLLLQRGWMAPVRIIRVAFCTLLLCTHTQMIFKSFSQQNRAVQKSVPLWKKKKKQLLWLCSLWKCQCCTATSVGLVCSTRGSINLVITKFLAPLFREKLIDLLIQWDHLRAREMSFMFTGFPLRHRYTVTSAGISDLSVHSLWHVGSKAKPTLK